MLWSLTLPFHFLIFTVTPLKLESMKRGAVMRRFVFGNQYF